MPVTPDGIVDLEALAGALSPRTTVVAVMTANNETGVVQPMAAVVAIGPPTGPPRAVVFTDAVQAAPWLDLSEATAWCRPGVAQRAQARRPGRCRALGGGRAGDPRRPRPVGGGQERERRSGTQDVVGAVGLAAAVRIAAAERDAVGARVAARRDRLRRGLLAAVPGVAGHRCPNGVAVLPGHLHLCLPGIEREELLVALGREGVCISGGSSCASGALEPSLCPRRHGRGAPRGGRGAALHPGAATTSDAEVERALDVVPAVVERLRRAVVERGGTLDRCACS